MLAAALLLLLYTLARPGPALVALAGLLLGAGRAQAQRPTAGIARWRPATTERAAAEFLKEAARGTARDTAFYNAGIGRARRGAARRCARRAGRGRQVARPRHPLPSAVQPRPRRPARRRGRHQPAEEFLDEAVDRLRQALMLEPSSARAKWNLELADRRKPPPPPAVVEAAAVRLRRRRRRAEPAAPPRDARARVSRQSQAEQILNSMERREQETRADQQRRLQSGWRAG